jgi:hypothetical protein
MFDERYMPGSYVDRFYEYRAVMESNHYKAHQCQLKSPWPEEIPGGNTNRCVPSLLKDEALLGR